MFLWVSIRSCQASLDLLSLCLLLLLDLEQQGTVDVGQDTSKGNGGTDQRVELFVATDGELQVAGGDALDLEILGGVLTRGKSRVSMSTWLGSLGCHEAAE